MKKITIYIIGCISLALGMTACDDTFLDRTPQTAITVAGFFKTTADLQTYSNSFYNDYNLYTGPAATDWQSDNLVTRDLSVFDADTWNMLWGTINVGNVSAGGWNSTKWASLRKVNFMLQNLQNVDGNAADIQHYVGITRYFRAYFYINMVSRYSDVPWQNKALETTDPDVFKPSDPRTLVVDSIIADLEFAAANISDSYLGNKTRINRYAALSLLSRFALYEGTFRKYHPELALESTANAFLQKAEAASKTLMESGKFSIAAGTAETISSNVAGINGSPAYRALFTTHDLSGNGDVILWRDANVSFNSATADHINRGLENYSLSRDLMETVLMADGSRFTEQPGYAVKTVNEVCVGRDPRYAEIFAYPGFANEDQIIVKILPSKGGYGQIKYYPRDKTFYPSSGTAKVGMSIYRYAEALLNYAEAKAELGTLTQADLDASVKLLRDRVAMPAINLAEANSAPCPFMAAQYPNVTGANRGIILELRRERRVEMSCEGFRLWDLSRWYAGQLFGKHHQGIYIPALGAYDVTDDGIEDVAILQNETSTSPIDALPEEVKAGLIRLYLDDGVFYLSEGNKGYIMVESDNLGQGKHFEEPKFYYYPIPQEQLTLNPNLQQQTYWR